MRKQPFLYGVLVSVMALVLAACGGLAGEPKIVGELPAPPRQQQSQTVALELPAGEPDLALGENLYAARCASCHGETGAGDGDVMLQQDMRASDFTDPVTKAGDSLADYYTVVTNGRLDKLMPPFSGSLNPQERLSVAAYVYQIDGSDLPESEAVAEADTDTADSESDSGVTTAPGVENPHGEGGIPTTTDGGDNPHTSGGEVLTDENGDLLTAITVSGQLSNQSEGGDVPADVPLVLHVVDADFNEELINGTTDSEGRYVFDDIPYSPQTMYVVTTTYNGNFFRSDITQGDANPLTLDIPVYDSETDNSVLSISQVMLQIDRLQNGEIHVFQRVHVTNNSTDMYMTDNGSVEIPLPDGAQPSQNLDTNRYEYLPDENVIIDKNGVRPGEHVSVVAYIIPQSNNGTVTFSQAFDYPAAGTIVVFADAMTMGIAELQAAGNVENDGRTLTHYTGQFDLAAGQPLTLTINSVQAETAETGESGFPQNMLAYGLMFLGVLAVAFGVTSYLFRDSDDAPADDPTARMDTLMARITALDEQFENGDIDEATYQTQRKRLKSELAQLMG